MKTSAAGVARKLTLARLKELLHYDPDTGEFIRLVAINGEPVGCRAGSQKSSGYRYLCIDYVIYAEHNLAWFYMTGEWRTDQDHKNTHRHDNRWDNLRLATKSQNQMNTADRPNKTGFRGVSRTLYGKYRAVIYKDGRKISLGSYPTPEEAHEVYKSKAKELFGEFVHVPNS